MPAGTEETCRNYSNEGSGMRAVLRGDGEPLISGRRTTGFLPGVARLLAATREL